MGASDFSKMLTELRRKKGISQKTAAEALQVSQALLSHYEKGIRECGLDFVVKAANYYKVSCDYLLGNNNSSVSFDVLRKTSDIPEDVQMSVNTLFRATGVLWSKIIDSDEKQEMLYDLYAIYDYIILINAAEKGYIPKEWIILNNSGLKTDFLFSLLKIFISRLPEKEPEADYELPPKCINTLTKFVSEHMNVALADLIV